MEFWQRPEVTGHYKKIPPLYLGKNLLVTAGNLKVNEQTKYLSVQFLLIPSDREKAGNTEVLSLRNKSEITAKGVKIDTSDINFLNVQLSLDRSM